MDNTDNIIDDRSEENMEEGIDAVTADSERILSVEEDIFGSIAQKLQKPKKKRSGTGAVIVIFAVMLALTAVTAVYCIVSDVMDSRSSKRYSDGKFILETFDRPEGAEHRLRDESGRYTVEGVSQVMRPSIVEIYVYERSNDTSPKGSGSGIIISTDGRIVTNAHVIDGMKKILVNTSDGRKYTADVMGKDSKTDIAVISIQPKGKLTAAQLGRSEQLVQGEQVVAVGNPAGLTGSVSSGIVSGLNRKIRSDATGYEMDCIQTDAAISPGNSGGALVNMYGQVVGITSSKYAAMTTEGLGFAISIKDAKPIIEELVSKGYVSGRVRIGITFYTDYAGYNEVQFKKKFGYDMPDKLREAVWIEKISSDCDIAGTKLKAGDFILSIGSTKTTDYSSVCEAIKGKKANDTLRAKCARIDKNKKIEYFDIEFKLMEDRSGDF